MREIKFRGWSVELQEWIYGSLLSKERFFYIFDNGDWCRVVAESVGMFTGVIAEDDVEIYEGDRLVAANGSITEVRFGVWEWEYDGCDGMEDSVGGIGFSFSDGEPFGDSVGRKYKVIGNVFINKK
jgi:hypothetical protein